MWESVKECETNLYFHSMLWKWNWILVSIHECISRDKNCWFQLQIIIRVSNRAKAHDVRQYKWMQDQSLYFHSMLWKWNCIYFLGHIKSLYFRTISWRWDWFHVSIRDRKWNVHDSIPTVSRQMKHRSKKISLLSFYCLEMKLNPCKYSRMYFSR